jgi:hypothetical protein
MNTVLIVDLIKGSGAGLPATPWPRIESDGYIMSAGSARPLEDAFRIAQHDMVTWVAALCSLDPIDAYQFVTQAVESPLANVCDTNYTSIAKMPKRYLPTSAYDGVHAHLRELAASLLSSGEATPRTPPSVFVSAMEVAVAPFSWGHGGSCGARGTILRATEVVVVSVLSAAYVLAGRYSVEHRGS